MAIETIPTLGTSVGSLVATTIANYRKQMADNIFTAIPFLAFMLGKNRMTEDGGTSIVVPVMYAKNSTAKSYSGEDLIDTTIQDPFVPAQYQWRFYADTVSLLGTVVDVKNNGASAVVNYTKAIIKHAEASIKDRLNIDLFAASATSTSVTPLPVLIDSSGSVGEINGTTQTWWQSIETASGSFAARGLSDLRGIFSQVEQRNPMGAPDFIVSDRTAYEAYKGTLVPTVRYTDAQMGDLGFVNVKYEGAIWAQDANATSGNVFVIHSPSLNVVTHSNRNFKLGNFVESISQDLTSAKIFWAGELVTDNRRKLGKMTGVTA